MNTRHIAAVTVLLAAAVVPVANADTLHVSPTVANCTFSGNSANAGVGGVGGSYLGLAVQTVRNRAGEIPGRKRLGRKVLYDRNVLDRWIERNNGRTDLFIDGVRLLK